MFELGLPFYPAPDAGLRDFLALYLTSYVGLLVAYFAVAGFFHWLNARHPERRIQKRPAKNQVAMEIRQSIIALATISLYPAAAIFMQAKGWTIAPFELSFVSVIVTFVISMVLFDAWFYWAHRLMHTKPLYRFHAHHHKSVVPTPWSNNSDSTIGAFAEQSYFLCVVFVLPIPPEVLIAHKLHDHVTGIVGHAGHEYFASPSARFPWPMLCTTYHDQHHGSFNYNYASTFSWWDRMMGTIHPDYDKTVKEFESGERGQKNVDA